MDMAQSSPHVPRINHEALTAIRVRSGYSKAVLSSLAEVSPGYLTELEQGKKPGSPEVIVKLANALNCPVGALLANPEQVAS